MSTINTWARSEALIGGVNHDIGSLSTPGQITLGSDHVHIQRFSVTDTSTQKIFDVADDLADFDYLYIVSDQTIECEFVVADGGNVVVFVLTFKANIPFILADDASRDSNHTEDWGADGTADTIDKLTVKNSSGATANVEVRAYT